MLILKDKPPINHSEKQIDSIIRFIKEVYNDEQIDAYLDFMIKENYKPGMVYHGIRISNHSLTMFLKNFGKTEMTTGYIINKKYVNDIINVFDIDATTLVYDEDTLMLTDNIDDKYNELKDTVKKLNNVSISDENDILIIASDDIKTLEEFKSVIKLDQVLIPKNKFKWV
jgi:hypothetical protein